MGVRVIVSVAVVMRMHVFDAQVPVHMDMHEIINLQKTIVGQDILCGTAANN